MQDNAGWMGFLSRITADYRTDFLYLLRENHNSFHCPAYIKTYWSKCQTFRKSMPFSFRGTNILKLSLTCRATP